MAYCPHAASKGAARQPSSAVGPQQNQAGVSSLIGASIPYTCLPCSSMRSFALPHLIFGQRVSSCGPFILQKIQLSASLHFPRKLGRSRPLLCSEVSAAFLYGGFESIHRDSCIHMAHLSVQILSGAQQQLKFPHFLDKW